MHQNPLVSFSYRALEAPRVSHGPIAGMQDLDSPKHIGIEWKRVYLRAYSHTYGRDFVKQTNKLPCCYREENYLRQPQKPLDEGCKK